MVLPTEPAAHDAVLATRVSLARSLLCVALFAVGLGLGAGAVRSLLPLPDDSGFARKWAAYERHAPTTDILVVGSSFAMCGIVPATVERRLAERGFDLRVFNLGVPGLQPQEADRLLEKVIELRPPRLRLVLLELREWRPTLRTRDRGERAVEWHTPGATIATIRSERAAESSTAAWLRLAGLHAELGVRRAFGMGRVSAEALRRLGALPSLDGETWLSDDAIGREKGYVALEETSNVGAAEGHALFRADPPAWEALVRSIARERRDGVERDASNDAPLRRRLRIIARAPFEVVQMVSPTDARSAPRLRPWVDDGVLPPFWDFADPLLHPGLFVMAERYDDRHFARPGAERFSLILADRIADHLAIASERAP